MVTVSMKPDERTAYRKSVVAQWRESGLSQKQFSRESKIAQSTLADWIKRETNDSPQNFASVIVTPKASAPYGERCFILHVNGGSTLEIPPGMPSEALKNLFSVLGILPC